MAASCSASSGMIQEAPDGPRSAQVAGQVPPPLVLQSTAYEVAGSVPLPDVPPGNYPGIHNVFRLSDRIISGSEPHDAEALAQLAAEEEAAGGGAAATPPSAVPIAFRAGKKLEGKAVDGRNLGGHRTSHLTVKPPAGMTHIQSSSSRPPSFHVRILLAPMPCRSCYWSSYWSTRQGTGEPRARALAQARRFIVS